MDITKVIGLEGGKDGTWFRVLAEEGRGTSTYYPAIVDGEERGWSSFKSLDEYLAHKVEREQETIRLTVAGNAVAAEDAIQLVLGCKALATTPITVDVYPGQPLVATPSAASALGSMTSEKKAAAARENGKLGGRPRKDANIYPHTENGQEVYAVCHWVDSAGQYQRPLDAEERRLTGWHTEYARTAKYFGSMTRSRAYSRAKTLYGYAKIAR